MKQVNTDLVLDRMSIHESFINILLIYKPPSPESTVMIFDMT